VRGIDRFRKHFAEFTDRYVIIGGTACDLALTNAGLEFRATRDIDIVLCVEKIDTEFVAAFWSFIEGGGYESREVSSGERTLYRFQKPTTDGYPFMLELFARVPDSLGTRITGHLTPIPVDDDVSSLSAILLDADYYALAHEGRIEIAGLPIVRPEHLIPLKARAWLDLTGRSAAGHHVDSKNIRKHRNDVFRLHAIADPEYQLVLVDAIRSDMGRFVEGMRGETIELKHFGLFGITLDSVLETLARRYA